MLVKEATVVCTLLRKGNNALWPAEYYEDTLMLFGPYQLESQWCFVVCASLTGDRYNSVRSLPPWPEMTFMLFGLYHLEETKMLLFGSHPLEIFFNKHDDVIKWKHFRRYWPFVRGIHRSPVISPHTGQWRRALMFSLICTWMNGWVNNREAGELRRYRVHYDVIVMDNCVIAVIIHSLTSCKIITK